MRALRWAGEESRRWSMRSRWVPPGARPRSTESRRTGGAVAGSKNGGLVCQSPERRETAAESDGRAEFATAEQDEETADRAPADTAAANPRARGRLIHFALAMFTFVHRFRSDIAVWDDVGTHLILLRTRWLCDPTFWSTRCTFVLLWPDCIVPRDEDARLLRCAKRAEGRWAEPGAGRSFQAE